MLRLCWRAENPVLALCFSEPHVTATYEIFPVGHSSDLLSFLRHIWSSRLQIKQGQSCWKDGNLAYNVYGLYAKFYYFPSQNPSGIPVMKPFSLAYKIVNDLNNFISPPTLLHTYFPCYIHYNIITLIIYKKFSIHIAFLSISVRTDMATNTSKTADSFKNKTIYGDLLCYYSPGNT